MSAQAVYKNIEFHHGTCCRVLLQTLEVAVGGHGSSSHPSVTGGSMKNKGSISELLSAVGGD